MQPCRTKPSRSISCEAGAAATIVLICLSLAGCKSAKEPSPTASEAESQSSAEEQAARELAVSQALGEPAHQDAAAEHAAAGHPAAGHDGAASHGAASHTAAGHTASGQAGHGGAAGRHHPPAATSALLGKSVPDFALTDSAGKAFKLEDVRSGAGKSGKISVLTFWCTTCSSCRMIEKDFDAMAREHAGKDVEFLMVDANFNDDAARVNSFLAKRGLAFRVLMDSHAELARAFGTKLTTTTAVLDADGRMRYYGAYKGAEAALGELLAGKEVSVPSKPADG